MDVQVGRWDCKHCGHVGNLGPETKCAGCGAPRDPDIKFYLPEDAEFVTDEESLRKAEAGADWTCDHCGADNKAGANRCRSCGNPRTTDDAAREEKEYDLSAVPTSAAEAEGRAAPPPPPTPPRKPASRRTLLGCLALLVLLVGGLVYAFYPRAATVKVVGHHWERTLEIENFRPVQEEGWSLPAGANLLKSFKAIHHHDRVLDHYVTRTRNVKVKVGEERYACGKKDMGNGYFKTKYCTRPKYQTRQESYQDPVYRQVPVFRTKYQYNVNRWVRDRIAKASGQDHTPKWPQGPPAGQEWRTGEKTETYWLQYVDPKGKEHQDEVKFQTWEKYDVGEEIPASMDLMGNVTLKTGENSK